MNHFTTHQSFFLVPLSTYDEEFKKIDQFLKILDKSNIDSIIESSYSKCSESGRKSYNPYHLFSMISYCFAKSRSSLREMEDMCRYDIRVMYLMDNQTPSHKTIGEFINEVIVPNHHLLFARITDTIIEEYNLDISDQYLDGTKLEANANKYKFVWKPVKYHKSLDKKIRLYLDKIGIYINQKEYIKSYQFYNYINDYANLKNINIETIPSGRGKKLSLEQRLCKEGYKCLLKLIEYEEKESICGDNRNSYYKTDHDATAMALKTDYYSGHGTNMHAAYNVQILVSSGIITYYDIFQDRTDYYTLIPMLDGYYKYYGKYPKNLCADSGYGIYSNYQYLDKHNIGNYVKFLAWNGESSGKNPQKFFSDGNTFLCLNKCAGIKIPFDKNHHQRYKDGILYQFEGCEECGYAYKCKEHLKNKSGNSRAMELIPKYEFYKNEARINLLSRKGIEIRVNRSIQVEGTFGQIKENMDYIRIRRRGINKVVTEIMLVCLGRNIRKIFAMIKSKKTSDKYWIASPNLEAETFKTVKLKKTKKL